MNVLPQLSVIHPTGRPITQADLPPEGTRRWTPMRKAEVVACIQAGMITSAKACELYMMSEEELFSWGRLFNERGLLGLHATRLQDYRKRTDSAA